MEKDYHMNCLFLMRFGARPAETLSTNYRDVFRQEGHDWRLYRGVRTRKAVRPVFWGTDVQRILDAALLSHQKAVGY